MIWTNDNLESGEIIGFPAPTGDFKDLCLLSRESHVGWRTVSLLDGLISPPVDEAVFIERLNKHHAMPIAKVLGLQERGLMLPENRARLPIVTILNMRQSK